MTETPFPMPSSGLLALACAGGGEPSVILAPQLRPGYAVVTIHGALTNHRERPAEGCLAFDCYDGILERVRAALVMDAPTVVLEVDSPGGHWAGALDAAQTIRAASERAGKRLVAFVSGQCLSAAYALACAGEHIFATPGSLIGSIGLVEAILDQTMADKAMGHRWEFVTTGKRKADGNPHTSMSSEALWARLKLINSLGQTFFEFVAERRNLSAAKVKSFDGATFSERAAKSAGLIDGVTSRFELFEALSKNQLPGSSMSPFQEAIEALRKTAASPSATLHERDQARRALAALNAPSGAAHVPPDLGTRVRELVIKDVRSRRELVGVGRK